MCKDETLSNRKPIRVSGDLKNALFGGYKPKKEKSDSSNDD